MAYWKFFLLTFGCKVNQYETQAVREAWQVLGGEETTSPEHADVCLVNSCAVTHMGERDARTALHRLRRVAPHARLIVTGCAALLISKNSAYASLADICVPPQEKILLQYGPWKMPSPSSSASPFGEKGFGITTYSRHRAVVKIQDGCTHCCTYCIVPLVRGRSHSRAPQEILQEIQTLLHAGFREILLSGINLQQYAWHTPHSMDFWALLHFLDTALADAWSHKARLRISSLEPSQIHVQALKTLQSCRMLCPHVHLSLQHGSPYILERMGRNYYDIKQLKDYMQELRTTMPHMGVGADILMGFPGETEQHVQETFEVIKALGLSYAHVFPYSRRPGTKAATFTHQISNAEKKMRTACVRHLVQQEKQAYLQRLLKVPQLHVIFDAAHENTHTTLKGVSEHYVPCVLPHAASGTAPGKEICLVKPVDIVGESIMVQRI